MKKVLIVGKNAYLAEGIKFDDSKFDVDKVRRISEVQELDCYDYIVNFCIQPEHFSRFLSEDEMIDVQIARKITNPKTKFIFLSSRKVYGSNTELKKYSETDITKPFDFYSKNKINIENRLKEILGKNLLILRTSNIVGLPPKHNSPTFISWLESELIQNKRVVVTADKNAIKDFISKEYFQYVFKSVIEFDLTGIYNVGAGFGISIEELMKNLVIPQRLLFDQKEDKGEQFILNCDKLQKRINKITKQDLLNTCKDVKTFLESKIY